jgi:hypothetical protein
VKIARSIRTRLNAVPASDAPLGIHKNDTIFSREGGAHRTNLYTGRIDALVAELRNKEASQDIPLFCFLQRFSLSSLNALDGNTAIFFYNVPLHPRSTKERLFRNVIFFLACFDAQATPDALLYVNAHSVEVIGRIIRSGRGFCIGILQKAPERSRGGNKQNGVF